MASSTSLCCARGSSMLRLTRQWYGHTAGILLLWTRLSLPWALLGAWFSGSAWPFVVGPVAAAVYPACYMLLRAGGVLPLRWLKTVDTLFLLLSAFSPLLAAPHWAMTLPASGLFVTAWWVNWRHEGSPSRPGEGTLPTAPAMIPPVSGPVSAGYRTYDRSHTGIDIAVTEGTPVQAPAAGVVLHAGPQEQWGYAVLIDHGEGWCSFMAHLERTWVRAGQQVPAGHLVGWSGTSGISTGPHVHLELRYRGVPVNPSSMLKGAGR